MVGCWKPGYVGQEMTTGADSAVDFSHFTAFREPGWCTETHLRDSLTAADPCPHMLHTGPRLNKYRLMGKSPSSGSAPGRPLGHWREEQDGKENLTLESIC